MLNALRRDRRTCRQANFNLEALDDRLVLSAGATGAIQEHRLEVKIAQHEAKLDKLEAKHEAKLAAKEARQEAKIAQLEVKATSLTPVLIYASGSATANPTVVSASGTASSTTATSTAVTTTGSSTYVPSYTIAPTATGTGITTTTTGSSTASPGPLPANVTAALQSLYQEYESAGGGSSFKPSLPSDSLLQISGDSVGVSLKMSSSGDFPTFLSQLQSDGLQVTSSSATYGMVDGMLPISDLPTIAQLASSVTPTSPPIME
jgi:hypothetical protein